MGTPVRLSLPVFLLISFYLLLFHVFRDRKTRPTKHWSPFNAARAVWWPPDRTLKINNYAPPLPIQCVQWFSARRTPLDPTRVLGDPQLLPLRPVVRQPVSQSFERKSSLQQTEKMTQNRITAFGEPPNSNVSMPSREERKMKLLVIVVTRKSTLSSLLPILT